MFTSRPVPRLLFAIAALAVVLLAGCTGGGSETDTDNGKSGTSTTESKNDQGAGDAAGSSDAIRVCDALTAVDPNAAFAGLTFGDPEPSDNNAWCRLPLTNAEGEGLTASLDTGGLYDAFQEQYGDNEDLYREIDGLGDEAFMLNNAQLHVRQGQDEWMVVLQAIVMEDEPSMPAVEATEAGLTEIARSLLKD